jgi:MOSC domain-containing protein YiiM
LKKMGHVSNLFLAVEHRKPMKAVDRAIALADRGFEGCIHGRNGSKRQLLLVDSETLTEFQLAPGVVRENITTAGLNMAELKPGQRLVIGSAVLEVTIPCEPCFRMDDIRMGLREALENRRGVLCRVIEGGQIACGDAIEMSGAAAASPRVGGAR